MVFLRFVNGVKICSDLGPYNGSLRATISVEVWVFFHSSRRQATVTCQFRLWFWPFSLAWENKELQNSDNIIAG